MAVLDEAGYTAVLGTNSDQTYRRHLRVGEQVSVTTRLESVVGPKKTGVGEGYFVTTRSTWRVGEEEVGSMSFRVLKFRPGTGSPSVDRSRTVRPVVNRDKRLVGIVSIGDLAKEEHRDTGKALGDIARPSGLHSQ